MQPDQIRELLEQVKSGASGVDEAFVRLAELPYSDLGDAKLDNHRALRCGFAEVVLCRGKEPRDVTRIIEDGLRNAPMMLATRAEKRHVDAIKERFPSAFINVRGGTVRVGKAVTMKARGSVMVVTAGTGDIPVAEEALETLRAFGCDAYHIYDVGVAGLHRVLAALPQLRQAAVIICVAGMEGALPSVVSGLVACPVIAVPTSIGYGASFNGLAALLGMLNSCAGGVSVVNIDNGFGAAMVALRMIADREWPIIAVPLTPAEIAKPDPAPAAQPIESPKTDASITRLERAIENLAAIAQKPVVVEAPKIEFNHPNQSEQIARLEKAIHDLAAIAAKQIEIDESKLTAKSAEQNDLFARLENTAQNLAALSNKAAVESPKIEISHPNHGEQIARLETAIVELKELAAKQTSIESAKPAEKSAGHDELLAGLARVERELAEVAAKNAQPQSSAKSAEESATPPVASAPISAEQPSLAASISAEKPAVETAAPVTNEKSEVAKPAGRGRKTNSQPRSRAKPQAGSHPSGS